MKAFIKKYTKTLLFFAVIGLIGGFFVGLYLLASYPESLRNELVAEVKKLGVGEISPDVFLGIITAVQSLGYGVILGGLGIFIAEKIGLWKGERALSKKPLIITAAISVLSGLLMILPDVLVFNGLFETIAASYAAKPTIAYILASVTYGAVIEEVMLRLFAMSLVAFLINRLILKSKEYPTPKVLIAANIVSALLFALAHLPTTFILLGNSPLIIVRCILLNGGLGLLYGYLYRKYGLRYAMIAHGGTHIVSKLVWLIFI